MKSMSSLVAIWLLFFVAIFAVGLLVTHTVYTRVMADLVVEETGLTTLEVKEVPKGALQTDQYTPIQPAEGLTLEELNGFTKVTEL